MLLTIAIAVILTVAQAVTIYQYRHRFDRTPGERILEWIEAGKR